MVLPTLGFLELPPELIQQILCLLNPHDLLSCQLTCKDLYILIRESVVLQYHIGLILAKAEDNPCSVAPLSEKLNDLRRSEDAWGTLEPRFSVSVPVLHNPSGIYDLTGGTYLLGNINKTKLHYLQLPTVDDSSNTLSWKAIKVDRSLIDLGLCVFEHDLIVIVTS